MPTRTITSRWCTPTRITPTCTTGTRTTTDRCADGSPISIVPIRRDAHGSCSWRARARLPHAGAIHCSMAPSMSHRRTRLLAVLLLASGAVNPLAHSLAAQPADTTKVSTEPLFTRRDAYLAMGFVVATALAAPLDEKAAQRLQSSGAQNETFFKDAS